MAEYGLLGEKLGHSYSPLIHSLLADYEYGLFERTPDGFREFIEAREFRGMNVTIPYKRLAYDMADELSDDARRLGNVNTLVIQSGGRLVGHNTDWYGFLYSLGRTGINFRGKRAAVLGGDGGAARTARAALIHLGCEVVSVSRSGPVIYDALYSGHQDVQIIVNATPVGMYPHNGASPVELERLPGVEFVFDMIYNPHRTRLILDAEARGIPNKNGLTMLVAQAARAKELFTGEPVPPGLIETITRTLARERLNMVLIGMPGSGKTSVARKIAMLMEREFVDIDQLIERTTGETIPETFARVGEVGFRVVERDVIASVGARGSLVIATGGGAVLNKDNVRALRQNGVLVLLERALSLLPTDGRPLSVEGGALEKMAVVRKPFYDAAADIKVTNDTTIDEAAQAALGGFYEAAGN